jgi:hypothetical protein
MCHGHTSDWYAERRSEFERADDETDEPDTPEYDDGMAGREVDEPAVETPDFEEPDVDETPELEDEEQPAAAPSDD